MRNLLKLTLVLAVAMPVAAMAGITSSKHNLSSVAANTNLVKSTGSDQLCVFCHTPHKAPATKLLWNKSNTATVSWVANSTTTAGTPLPTSAAALGAQSRACLSCHDGTTSMGSIVNMNNSSATIAFATATTDNDNTGKLINNNYAIALQGMNGNHPVSVPYKTGTYNSITSLAKSAEFAATSTSCTGVALCTSGPSGGLIELYGTSANAGIECSSCHEPHLTTNSYFLRVNQVQSALCLTCHIK